MSDLHARATNGEVELWQMESGRLGIIALNQNPNAIEAARDMLRLNGAEQVVLTDLEELQKEPA